MPYARVNGADLYYEERGSGPPVIFHHGYTSSHDCWEGVVPRLADRYRCIAMDGRGAGDSSSAPGPYTLAQYADDVCGIADALGIDRFRYVGLSMGGATGYELGLRHADRLESMVLVAPAPADGIQNGDAGHAHSQDQRRRQAREEMLRERMLTGGFVDRWKNRQLNIHPSLLPSFPGLDTHERALRDGVRIHGCTVHFVRLEMDTGPIIAQAAVAVLAGDTPESLAQRVLAAEHKLYPHALSLVASGAVTVEDEEVTRHHPDDPPPPLFSPALRR